MAEPVSHEPDKADHSNEIPEVHFAETVSVVTEVNKLAEAPLIDAPLELTTKDDVEGARANEHIRQSASLDRDMKDEEGLVLRAEPREPSEDPPAAVKSAVEVAEGVEQMEISKNAGNKRKNQDETEQTNDIPKGRKETGKGRKSSVDRTGEPNKTKTKTRRVAGGRRRNSMPSKDEPEQELRRSKRIRRKSQ